MIDPRDLDHRLFGYNSPVDITESNMTKIVSKHIKAVWAISPGVVNRLKDLGKVFRDLSRGTDGISGLPEQASRH